MSDVFPEEIIHKILLKLPAKSLIKYTLVCKSWHSLIKSSTFIQSHLRTTIDSSDQNDSHLLLLSASSNSGDDAWQWHQRHWLHWDSPEFGEYSMLSTPVLSSKKKPVSEMHVAGTSNGLVCLEAGDGHFSFDRSPTLIWNPTIRKLVRLPKPPVCFRYTKCEKFSINAFGYDAHSNDYKILRIVTLIDDHSDLSRFATKVHVYSLARASWKRFSSSVVPVDLQGVCGSERPVFVNGNFHTLENRLSVYYNDNYEEHHKCGGELFISTFNLETEEFGEIKRPEALGEGGCNMSRYGDSLALIKHHNYSCRDPVNRGCDIWAMKQYGVAESWTYLFNLHVVQTSIYGFKECGEVVLMESTERGRSRMVSFDPKTNQFKVFGTEGHFYRFMDSFVESLVLLDHAKAVSYRVATTK
ncbi:PREDICTED: F-box/kelch-repeat protein At3g23880-like [Fragaria vesca subsp. vesca]|uniref:F-box/kelch-repeat protein At3g23880-like n=1 Tax=Fragaria vesca subsp. vesca TaxID=101020 RepID=UPI0002C2E240|nr:PREDICTED: F-box/kelch-repeat protein At3g23880-like [Fragaria vesca subsp. vesca]